PMASIASDSRIRFICSSRATCCWNPRNLYYHLSDQLQPLPGAPLAAHPGGTIRPMTQTQAEQTQRDSAPRRYEKVLRRLEEQMLSGKYAPGDKLPSERALMMQF